MTPALAVRDPFGRQRQCYHLASGHQGHSLSAVLQAADLPAGRPDVAAIQGLLTHQRLPGRTVLQGIRAVPPGHALHQRHGIWLTRPNRPPLQTGDLATRLRHALHPALVPGTRAALALSGGLDSALLLALLHTLGGQHLPVYILTTDLPGYCERDAALDMAQRLGATVRLVPVRASALVTALPQVVRTVEEPIFNLHPVSKWRLAEAMAQDGITLAITGDGADQVLRRDTSANYLPLCQSLFDAAGVELLVPFLDPAVLAHLLALPPDPDKACLRQLGAQLALPERLVHGPKQGRLAPALSLGALAEPAPLLALARQLGLPPPDLSQHTVALQWASLHLLLQALPGVTLAPRTLAPFTSR